MIRETVTMASTDVLVVGAGAGGLAVAAEMRQISARASVTVATESTDQLYWPWLIYAPAGRLQSKLAPKIPLRPVADRHGFRLLIGGVREIDLVAKRAVLDNSVVGYRVLVIAAGAPADRGRLPGAAEHALFPCDAPDANRLTERLASIGEGAITFVLTGERIGPGLEYAAWLARAQQELGERRYRVQVVSDGDTLTELLGLRGVRRVGRLLEGWKATLELGTDVAAIESDGVRLADERRLASALTNVVGPLRGPDIGLPEEVTDARGFVIVDRFLRSPLDSSLLAVGDAATVPGEPWRKSWQLAIRQAPVVAANAAAELAGTAPRPFDSRVARRRSRISLPDVGGTALLVVNRRLLLAGSLAGRLRARASTGHSSRGTASIRARSLRTLNRKEERTTKL